MTPEEMRTMQQRWLAEELGALVVGVGLRGGHPVGRQRDRRQRQGGRVDKGDPAQLIQPKEPFTGRVQDQLILQPQTLQGGGHLVEFLAGLGEGGAGEPAGLLFVQLG